MAKKNKIRKKINQKIKKYFDNDPFDVGIERVDVATLSELLHFLGIYDVKHTKPYLLKVIRMIWSEADSQTRKDILQFFMANETIYYDENKEKRDRHKEEKLKELLQDFSITQEEKLLLYEEFAHIKTKNITTQKIEAKLNYIRFEQKKQQIQKMVDGVFDIDNSLEFHASLQYKIFQHHFHKIFTLNTKPYNDTYLFEHPLEEIVQQILQDKEKVTKQKQQSIDTFIQNLKIPHPYLTEKEIEKALRSAPPKTPLLYPPLDEKILQSILQTKYDIKEIMLYQTELILSLHQECKLPYTTHLHPYILEIPLELDPLLKTIWEGEELQLDDVISHAKKEQEESFFLALKKLVSQCQEYATQLHFSDEAIYNKIYTYLLALLPKTLTISAKVAKKTLRTFIYHIQDEIIQKQRQDLLAKTIRDFKNLFPLARQLRRKLILHIGPTNSGKTYQAMQQLKQSDTGYYLAPLRLLALEGYEDLQQSHINASLITGEEQIIDDEATHISSTIEMLNFDVDVDVCVIDEVQMIDDRDRGWAWANAIIGAPAKTIIMTGSLNAKEAIIALANYLQEPLEIIEFERKTPLTLLHKPIDIKHITSGTAVVAFSRKNVLKLKETLAKHFRVSVIYGNLSPEVRREEARRFREKETDVLVATDAIAMGLNLPIQTILFSTAKKFDGIFDRQLTPSEVKQIAGRAGRFGLSEEGFVGALNTPTLKIIQNKFTQEIAPIHIPFRVMANLDHIKLVSSILHENSLEKILQFFAENMEFNGPFYAANLEDMVEASHIVDKYQLDITTKYHLASAPLTLKSPYVMDRFQSYLKALEKKQPIPYNPPKLAGSFAHTTDEMLQCEDMIKEISLYLWLSYRFEEYFIDAQKAREYRSVLNKYMENSLQKSHFVQKCRSCNKTLPPRSKHSICEHCYKKNHQRRRRRPPKVRY
ncbi:Helicase-like [hydrothermal vent metagenome]|uniref:Helicase-like n=1 Tax=hydrothermal vent metagenome TaxID=652676 RepID=A0A1W1D5K7_9ZZZZ